VDGADAGQQLAHLLRTHRPGVVVTLRDVAAELAQRGDVLGTLDALGDDRSTLSSG
jgi:hypothetical protein